MTLLAAQNLTVTRGGRNVLEGVDLAVAPGEVVGVIGPNGAGKTSLLRVLGGIDRPGQGQVLLDGRRLDSIPRRARARSIAFLPQPPESAWPVTVGHLVSLGRLPFASSFGRPSAEGDAAIESALAATELTALRDRIVTTLSAGEASRAFLARALAGAPRLLLADEPTANLDPAHQLRAMGALRALASRGVSVVMAQHDLPLASRFCDRLVLIARGGVLADGKPAHVLTAENMATAFRVIARYAPGLGEDFYALPWSLAEDAASHDILAR